MTQEFHLSVTPIRGNDYLVRTERVAPGVPLAEEQVNWPVEDWLAQAGILMNDPLLGLLRGDPLHSLPNSLEQAAGITAPSGPSTANLVAFGQTLYNALFQGMVRDSWMTAKGIAQHRREILRLRLGLKDVRLPRLPWEVMQAGDRPIATGTDVIFSRYHSSFAVLTSSFQQTPVTAPDQPLRILMVLAAPTDQEVLALRQEAQNLQQELQHPLRAGNGLGQYSDIELTIVDQPDREELTQALEHNHYQVFHYAGHSNLGASGGNLYLVSRKTGLTEVLSGNDLAGLLVNNGIRMAVFNSCRGVYTATSSPASESKEGNLAEALIKRGIPAVLAMAERIPDAVALNLSRLFYRNLKQAYPIDLSLSRARQGLISSYSSNQLYWALPILYLHPQFDGYLRQPLVNREDDRLPADLVLEAGAAEAEPDAGAIGLRSGAPVLAADNPELFDGHELEPGEADYPLDPDDPEFDDLTYEFDAEGVAQLVKELSQAPAANAADDRPLYAAKDETLLPEPEYQSPFTAPSRPIEFPAISGTTPAAAKSSPLPMMEAMTSMAVDVELYAELEQMLADAGKLSNALATAFKEVRLNPNDAETHHNLGWVLYQRGYIVEAIAAYQQAIRLNPTLAAAHYHLGLALTQQVKLDQAIQSYQRAIELNPNFTDAYRQLEAARSKLGRTEGLRQEIAAERPVMRASVGQPAGFDPSYTRETEVAFTANPDVSSAQAVGLLELPVEPPPSGPARRPQKPWLWVGVGMVGAAIVLGSWVAYQQLVRQTPLTSPSPDTQINLRQDKTGPVASRATEQLNQGNIAAARESVEALLDRGALLEAEAVLSPSRGKYLDDPTMNFLMGRLVWQQVQTGNKDYGLDDARRYWETAVKQQPTPRTQMMLGFAYYEEGELDRARKAWFRTLELLGEQSAQTSGREQSVSTSTKSMLTAYAGIALTLMKSAQEQLPSQRASVLSEAIRLRQKILTDDPVHFQPDALAKDWMWSEQAIQDWQTLLTIKNPSDLSNVKP